MALIHTQLWKLEEFLIPRNYQTAGGFKLALMQPGFIFSAVTHQYYELVMASELANAFGYGTGGQTMTTLIPVRDDASLSVYLPFNPVTWTASGGNLATQGAIMYWAIANQPNAMTIVGYIDFGDARTVLDGSPITVANIRLRKV